MKNDNNDLLCNKSNTKLKVAILGVRGIPACYGGFDTFIEELALRLSKSNDIELLIYCRSLYYKKRPKVINGIKLVYLPSPRTKALESLLHSFLSSVHVLSQKVDIVYFVDPANAPFCLILRLFRKTMIIHTDGLGWKRKKWSLMARRYYKFAEWLATKTAAALITDNPIMQEYYRNEYCTDSVYIPYGASNHAGINESLLNQYSLSKKGYLLVVARLEPENNTDLIIKGFNQSKTKLPLVIVGDSPYNPKHKEKLKEISDNRVHFVGHIFDQEKLNALYSNAYLYIHGHEVGGTNPSLLRAMNFGVAPVVIDVPFNRSVIADCGFIFGYKSEELSSLIDYLVNSPNEVSNKGNKAKERAEALFRWDFVIEKHKKLFYRLKTRKSN